MTEPVHTPPAAGGGGGGGGKSGILSKVVGFVILFIVLIKTATISGCGEEVRMAGSGGASAINSLLSAFRNNGSFFMGVAAFVGVMIWIFSMRKK